MKKKINFLDILKNSGNLGVPEKIDVKAYKAIQKAKENPPAKLLTLFFRPAFVYSLVALFLLVPLSVFVFTFRGNTGGPVVYTPGESGPDKENFLLEFSQKDEFVTEGEGYSKDVSRVDVRITSKGVIMKWKNPDDPALKEVIIEKRKKINGEVKTLFPGNVNFFVDPEYRSGDYYRIRCVNEKERVSAGVYVIPETDK